MPYIKLMLIKRSILGIIVVLFSVNTIKFMIKHLIIVLLFTISISATAQSVDSIIAVRKGATWYIKYTVKAGETVHMLAVRYYISDGVLEYANDADAMMKMSPGTIINIPVTKENISLHKLPLDGLRGLFCHVAPKDDISIISTYTGVTKEQIIKWNNLKGNTLVPGQALFIGWIKVMSPDSNDPAVGSAFPFFKTAGNSDSTVIVTGGMDTLYDVQTNHGQNVLTEKGTAVFFEKTGKNNLFVAFHNATPRGTIIKVFNPGNGKTIFVKVLGPLPDTKLYSNCIIGINDVAKEALGITDTKAWCELSYQAN